MTRERLHEIRDDATGVCGYIEHDPDGGENPLTHDAAVIFASLTRNYQNPAEKHGLKTQEDMDAFERQNCRGKSAPWAAFPLFMFSHSGTAYQVGAPVAPGERPVNPFSCPWDSGRVGWLFVKLSEIAPRNMRRAEKLAKAAECARITCEVYTQWANGEVYGYVIEDADGDTLDSCWGFIGYSDDEYLLGERKTAFDYAVKQAAKANADTAAAEIAESRPDLAPAY